MFKTAQAIYKETCDLSDKLNTQNRSSNNINSALNGTTNKNRTPTECIGEFVPDQLDIDILKLAKEKHHSRNIARVLNRAPSTIKSRLDKMENLGVIQSFKGAFNTKIYELSANINRYLIHNEAVASGGAFTCHCMEFKFAIIEGTQPKNKQSFKMNNWRGYVWHEGDYVIRSTPKNIIISVNLDLGAGNIDDLLLKYSEVAKTKAHSFASKYNISIGAPLLNRNPHYTIPDQALSQVATLRGEFKTHSGIKLDKSKSSGDLEMNEKQARAMEFVLSSMPEIVGELVEKYEALHDDVENMHSDIKEIRDHIGQILFLAQANDLSRKGETKATTMRIKARDQAIIDLQAQTDELYNKYEHLQKQLTEVKKVNTGDSDKMYS